MLSGLRAFARAVPSAWLPFPPSSFHPWTCLFSYRSALPPHGAASIPRAAGLIPDSVGPGCFLEPRRGGRAGRSAGGSVLPAWRDPLSCHPQRLEGGTPSSSARGPPHSLWLPAKVYQMDAFPRLCRSEEGGRGAACQAGTAP